MRWRYSAPGLSAGGAGVSESSPFKSGVTDYKEILKRWREIGSTLPILPGTENGVDVTPQPEEKKDPGHYDYGCGAAPSFSSCSIYPVNCGKKSRCLLTASAPKALAVLKAWNVLSPEERAVVASQWVWHRELQR